MPMVEVWDLWAAIFSAKLGIKGEAKCAIGVLTFDSKGRATETKVNIRLHDGRKVPQLTPEQLYLYAHLGYRRRMDGKDDGARRHTEGLMHAMVGCVRGVAKLSVEDFGK